MHRTLIGTLVLSCVLAIATAHAGDVPNIKPGLWATTTTTGDAKAPSQTVSMCTSTALLQTLFDRRLKNSAQPCKQISVAHSGNSTTEQTECKIGDKVVKSTAVTVVSGTTAVRTEVRQAGKGSITSDSKYVGECPAGMQLGDFVSADGMKSNILHPDGDLQPANAP